MIADDKSLLLITDCYIVPLKIIFSRNDDLIIFMTNDDLHLMMVSDYWFLRIWWLLLIPKTSIDFCFNF